MKLEIKKDYNLIDYTKAVKFMQNRVFDILNNNKNELIWFLNHDHIYTQGTSASNKEILVKNNIKTLKTNRGGKTTYHGPGQRITYFMINLNQRKKNIRKFITTIEVSLIQLLNSYNIEATTFRDRVGIWVIGKNGKKFIKEEKIGAIGLRLKKWITYHGLSFNINPDMTYYNNISACGLKDYKNTSLEELGVKVDENEFDRIYYKIFFQNLEKL
tara:strand:- start:20392 stop:21036 length:645 start_codon:yes stop_codon:yes gene_type:complete